MAKRGAHAAQKEALSAKAAYKQLADARITDIAAHARKHHAAVMCEQELSKMAMAAKNRAEAALAEERMATMAARAGRAAAKSKLRSAEQTIFGLQSQLAEAALHSTVLAAGTIAPGAPPAPQVPEEAASGGNAVAQQPQQTSTKDVSQQEPKQEVGDVMANMAAAQPGRQPHNKRAAEVLAQRATSAKRAKAEECAAACEGKGA